MKKALTSLVVVMIVTAACSSSASAQDRRRAPQRFDYDRGSQYLGGAVLGTLGVAGGGLAGVALSFAECPNAETFDCPRFVPYVATGVILFGVGGAILGTGLMGGEHAEGDQYIDATVGALVGTLVGVPLGIVALAGTIDSLGDASVIVGAVVAGASIGAGASFGYQSRYDAPILEDVTLAPMITPEHNGLMIMGRF